MTKKKALPITLQCRGRGKKNKIYAHRIYIATVLRDERVNAFQKALDEVLPITLQCGDKGKKNKIYTQGIFISTIWDDDRLTAFQEASDEMKVKDVNTKDI